MNTHPLLRYRWACTGRSKADTRRSEAAKDKMKRVVGWVLSLEFHRAAMVKIFPMVPMMQNIIANIAPMIEVVSLREGSKVEI